MAKKMQIFGLKGEKGDTPVKGVDYFTPSEKTEIIAEAVAQASAMSFHICGEGEVDENGTPIIAEPVENMFYLVPSGDETHNLFIEWAWVNNQWERFGGATVDLSNYVQKTDFASTSAAGIMRVNSSQNVSGLYLYGLPGELRIASATRNEILSKGGGSKPIIPTDLDYAVKVGLTTNTETFTDDEKKAARDLVGAVGNTDYAGSHPGIVSINANYGISVINTDTIHGELRINQALDSQIENKNTTRPITPKNMDYALKVAISTNTKTLTDEEQAAAQEWLGGQMIKTILPDADGNYSICTGAVTPGLYILPKGTVIKAVSSKILYTTTKGDTILLISSESETFRQLFLIGEGYRSLYGGYVYTDNDFGYFTRTLNFITLVDTHSVQTISSLKTFNTTPKMTAELAVDDNSTNIPNTQWVNAAIAAAVEAALSERGL